MWPPPYPQHLLVSCFQIAFPIPYSTYQHFPGGMHHSSTQISHEAADRMALHNLKHQFLDSKVTRDFGSVNMVRLFPLHFYPLYELIRRGLFSWPLIFSPTRVHSTCSTASPTLHPQHNTPAPPPYLHSSQQCLPPAFSGPWGCFSPEFFVYPLRPISSRWLVYSLVSLALV